MKNRDKKVERKIYRDCESSIRRNYNIGQIGLTIFNSIKPEMITYGLKEEDYLSILGGNIETIDTVSSRLVELIEKRDLSTETPAPVLNGEVGDSFINFFISLIADSIHANSLEISDAYLKLIMLQLKFKTNKYVISKSVIAKDNKDRAAWIIAQWPTKGSNELAVMMKVNKSTTSRWMSDPDFQMKVDKFKKMIKNKVR